MATIDDIKKRLENRKVGLVDWNKFSGIAIPLIETYEGLSLIFEVRSSKLKTQPGDICFPGGKLEAGEEPEHCALREMEEEIGIPASDTKVLGQFDTLHEFSGHTLYTFVVEVPPDSLEKLRINPDEVAEVFTVPVKFFQENEAEIYDIEVRSDVSNFPYEETGIAPDYKWRRGKNLLPLYRYKDKVIWGITARIVRWFVKKTLS